MLRSVSVPRVFFLWKKYTHDRGFDKSFSSSGRKSALPGGDAARGRRPAEVAGDELQDHGRAPGSVRAALAGGAHQPGAQQVAGEVRGRQPRTEDRLVDLACL